MAETGFRRQLCAGWFCSALSEIANKTIVRNIRISSRLSVKRTRVEPSPRQRGALIFPRNLRPDDLRAPVDKSETRRLLVRSRARLISFRGFKTVLATGYIPLLPIFFFFFFWRFNVGKQPLAWKEQPTYSCLYRVSLVHVLGWALKWLALGQFKKLSASSEAQTRHPTLYSYIHNEPRNPGRHVVMSFTLCFNMEKFVGKKESACRKDLGIRTTQFNPNKQQRQKLKPILFGVLQSYSNNTKLRIYIFMIVKTIFTLHISCL